MYGRRSFAIALAAVMAFTAIAQPTLGSNGPVDSRPGGELINPCGDQSPQRSYAVTSLPLPVSYNHWGDLDLSGQIYLPNANVDPVLTEVSARLAHAGLNDLATPVVEMRDALRAGDINAATHAAAHLVDVAQHPELMTPPTDRVDQTDLVQPLVLRAYIGECVTISLTNLLPIATSIHVHDLVSAPGEGEAVGLQAPNLTAPGKTEAYRFAIPDFPGMEGAHYLHSHADPRDQTRHGLFGALVAEPRGSTWLSTADGHTPAPTGLEAMIVQQGAPDFREFIQIYHDEITLVNWTLASFPSISPYGEYGPGTKGINLRTEPFMDRFEYQDELKADGVVARAHDKSQSYGSYTYGDPSTWIQRGYVGDPTKFRLINAGPGQYHIHHLHGGGIRWKSTPLAQASQFALGLTKVNPEIQSESQRLDVQNMGPGESFNLEPEGGTGGVQQGAGDFLYHCHIAEHYLAGMWAIWRSFNTIQPGLAELPDRVGDHAAAVNSTQLIGLQLPDGTVLDSSNIDAWVQSFLPAKGVPGVEDASVWNWAVRSTASGPLYLGEPETSIVWPDYHADAPGRVAPGVRPEIGFDPLTGKPAYPMLKPHFGERPPFAPEHGGTPWLKHDTTTQNPVGLCPSDTRPLNYNVVAIQAAVKYNKFDTDKNGQVFVRAEDRAAVDSGATNPTSIVLRGNVGDCIDVTLVNALKEKALGDFSQGIHTKTNIHIHLVQFDVQGSDGVVAGYNFETTLRPVNGSYKNKAGEIGSGLDPSAQTVSTIAAGGVSIVGTQTVISVASVAPFLDKTGAAKVGSEVGLGLGLTTIESAKLVSVDSSAKTITLDRILHNGHSAGEYIGYEWVHYTWFPDVELGTVYFHDHVNGIDTWRHGLFGSLIIEPKGSRWLDPKRTTDVGAQDKPVAHLVDIVPSTPGGPAYREFVLHFQDRSCFNTTDNCLDHAVPRPPNAVSEGAGFNMRSEPLHRRNAEHPFWSKATYGEDAASTPTDERNQLQGDPSTDALEAYPGDNVVIRTLYAGQSMSRGVGTFAVTGHRFNAEQYLPGSRTIDSISMAESTQLNLQLECGAGGCLHQPGDYMYYMTQPDYLQRGAWGLMRVYDPANTSSGLAHLPNNLAPSVGSIPANAPVKHYDVSAIEGLVAHNPSEGLVSNMQRFVTDDQIPAVAQAPTAQPPDPLVIRASPGDIVEVKLTNHLASDRVAMHASLVSAGPASQGINVGNGPDNTITPGHSITYRWYADKETGVSDLVSLVDPVNHAVNGLTGALVVEPAGATYSPLVGPAADIDLGFGLQGKEQVLLFATPDAQFQSSTMPYLPDVAGLAMVNYATEPLAKRMGALVPDQLQGTVAPISGAGVSTCHVQSDDCAAGVHQGDVRNPALPFATSGVAPWTPIINATFGQPLIIRAIGASGDQLATVSFDGQVFAADPEMDNCKNVLSTCRSNLISTVTLGAREVKNIWIPAAGAAGPGDYLYRNHRDAYFEAGAWGILRVTPDAPPVANLPVVGPVAPPVLPTLPIPAP